MLSFEHVTFRHPLADSGAPPVLDDVSFALERRAFAVVRGKSGAGKSTLLRLACRLEAPTSGRILFEGRPLEALPPPNLRRSLAYLPQTPATIPGTVRDNLLLPFGFKANRDLAPPSDDDLRMRLDAFQLDPGLLGRNAEHLSVGQRQRVCLIRTLLIEPDMLLMDEPASALDNESADLVMGWAEKLNSDRGVGVMVVTHGMYVPETDFVELHVENQKARLV